MFPGSFTGFADSVPVPSTLLTLHNGVNPSLLLGYTLLFPRRHDKASKRVAE